MHLHIGFHFSGVPNAVKHDEVDVCLFEEFTGTLKLRRVSIRRSTYDLNMAYIFVPFVLALLFCFSLGVITAILECAASAGTTPLRTLHGNTSGTLL